MRKFKEALTELVAKFHTLASSIAITAERVTSSAGQVSDGARALSADATEQAAPSSN